MSIKEFYQLWPTIKNKEVRIEHGYVKKHITFCKLISEQRLGQDVYLKSEGDICLTIRSIKSIKTY